MIVTIYPISIKIQQVVQLLYNYLQFPTISLQISYLCTNHFPKKKNWKLNTLHKPIRPPRPALPLSQLDHCLRAPSRRRAPTFWNIRGSRKKKWFLDETPKNCYILLTKEQKRKFFGPNKINCPKNNIINLQTNQNSTR